MNGAMFLAVLNSLWQAALIAALVWIALRQLPQVNAAPRYLIWRRALAVVFVLPFTPAMVASLRLDAPRVSAIVTAGANLAGPSFELRAAVMAASSTSPR